MGSYIIRFGTELYVYTNFKEEKEHIDLDYEWVVIYSILILVAEFVPLLSYISFLWLRRERLSTSVLMPSVRIKEIREE